MKIKELIEETIINKETGFSIELLDNGELKLLNKGDIKQGYLIGITNNNIKLKDLTESYIIRFIDSVRLIKSSGKRCFIGYWFDSDTNQHYLDISIYQHNIYLSEHLKEIFKQKSIFNLKTWSVV